MPGKTKIKEIMTKDMYSLTLNDTVKKADKILKEEKLSRLPVLEGEKFIGLVTEKKVMEYVLRDIYDPENNLGDDGFNKIGDFENILIPTSHVIYPEDSVQKAIKMMAKYKLDCIPVVDWDMNMVGLVTITDVLLFIHQKIEEGEFDN